MYVCVCYNSNQLLHTWRGPQQLILDATQQPWAHQLVWRQAGTPPVASRQAAGGPVIKYHKVLYRITEQAAHRVRPALAGHVDERREAGREHVGQRGRHRCTTADPPTCLVHLLCLPQQPRQLVRQTMRTATKEHQYGDCRPAHFKEVA